MPQSWIIMLVGLGFALALLASLVIARLIWLYLARQRLRRLRRSLPVEQASLEADRDRQLVENAMLVRRIEKTETALKQKLAERMAEVARYRNRLDAANAEITRLRLLLPLAPLPEANTNTPAADAAEARLRRRIDNLTGLAHQIERQRKTLRRRRSDRKEGPSINIASAEAEARELESELEKRLAKLTPKPKS